MTVYLALGDAATALSDQQLRGALYQVFDRLGARRQVLALPPDFTRSHSHAGPLTCMTYEYYGDRLVDVMPALGTHEAMARSAGEDVPQHARRR